MAGNPHGENDDPFAYLYRSEQGREPGQQPAHRTQQIPAVTDRTGDYDDWGPAGPAQQDAGYQGYQGYQAAPAEPRQRRHRAGSLAGTEGAEQRQMGPRAAVLVGVLLVVAAGFGVRAMLGGGADGRDSPAAVAASGQPSAPASSPPARATVDPAAVTGDKLELSGGATLATDHKGYTGEGFVSGLEAQGASLAWAVEVPESGSYRLTVRYSNALARDGQEIQRNLGVSANDRTFGQIRMPVIGSWDSWGTTWRTLRLKEGSNRIVLTCGPGDSCHVNIDTLRLSR